MSRQTKFFTISVNLELFFTGLARGLNQSSVLSLALGYISCLFSGIIHHYYRVLPRHWWGGLLSYIMVPLALVSLTDRNHNDTSTMIAIIITVLLQTGIFIGIKRVSQMHIDHQPQPVLTENILHGTFEQTSHTDDVCPICLEKMDEAVRISCCQKCFHEECVSKHVMSTTAFPPTCPCCRAPIELNPV